MQLATSAVLERPEQSTLEANQKNESNQLTQVSAPNQSNQVGKPHQATAFDRTTGSNPVTVTNQLTGGPSRANDAAVVSESLTDSGHLNGSGASHDSGDSKLDHPISTRWLLRFALPTIASTVLSSTFTTVDGVFAARVIDSAAFAVTNIVWPFISFALAVGFMFSIGGSAIVAKKLGQGKAAAARRDFTTLTIVVFGLSALLAAIGFLFPDFVFNILGVDEFLRPMATEYMRPLLALLPSAMLGFFMQQFFITEGRPKLGMMLALAGGVVNVGLNFLLIAHLQMGLFGAALSTGIGWSVPAVCGLLFFLSNRRGTLQFTRPSWDLSMLGAASVNGASEMVTMLAGSVTLVVLNNILMQLVGYEGVAAAGIMAVGQMLLMGIFTGFAIGVAPVISFNYGKRDQFRLRRLFKRSLIIITIGAAVAVISGWFLASPLSVIYVPRSTEIYQMAVQAFRFGLLGFLFMGVNAFASVMFTALNNGVVSGILSMLRTLLFVLAALATLPALLGLSGVWLALPVAEVLAFGSSLIAFKLLRGKYQYY
ncbi:MAG: MATE family efflux transporter [Promicromonosporaceae bacterium]|nr:MATE family efflux transporter [Promicromonosporaceae bacterium]